MPKPKTKTSPISRIDAAVKAFKKRSPCHHSPAFMLGLRAVLAVGESASPVVYCNPYRQRTAKFDAFRAGCMAGNTVHLPPRGLTNFQSWTGE